MGFMSGRKQEKKIEETYTAPRAAVAPKKSVTVVDNDPGTYIGKTMDIKADITSDENITIEGRVNGNIEVTKVLTIGRSGNVTADIKAAVVRIIGVAGLVTLTIMMLFDV